MFSFKAAVSHPDYKFKWITSTEKKNQAIDLLKKEKDIIEKEELGAVFDNKKVETKTKKPEFSMDYDDSEDEDESNMDDIDKWVKFKKLTDLNEVPLMKKIHLKYNTALGSQASVERLFSFAGLILGMRRGALKDGNFEKQLLIKANQKLNPKLFKKKEK